MHFSCWQRAVGLYLVFKPVSAHVKDHYLTCLSNSWLHWGLPMNESLQIFHSEEFVFRLMGSYCLPKCTLLACESAGYHHTVPYMRWGVDRVQASPSPAPPAPHLHPCHAQSPWGPSWRNWGLSGGQYSGRHYSLLIPCRDSGEVCRHVNNSCLDCSIEQCTQG